MVRVASARPPTPRLLLIGAHLSKTDLISQIESVTYLAGRRTHLALKHVGDLRSDVGDCVETVTRIARREEEVQPARIFAKEPLSIRRIYSMRKKPSFSSAASAGERPRLTGAPAHLGIDKLPVDEVRQQRGNQPLDVLKALVRYRVRLMDGVAPRHTDHFRLFGAIRLMLDDACVAGKLL